jgi:hypothetical protein
MHTITESGNKGKCALGPCRTRPIDLRICAGERIVARKKLPICHFRDSTMVKARMPTTRRHLSRIASKPFNQNDLIGRYPSGQKNLPRIFMNLAGSFGREFALRALPQWLRAALGARIAVRLTAHSSGGNSGVRRRVSVFKGGNLSMDDFGLPIADGGFWRDDCRLLILDG